MSMRTEGLRRALISDVTARWYVFQRRFLSTSTAHLVEEIRQALRVLSLPDSASDAEVRDRFQSLAKSNHPDVLQGGTEESSVAEDKMRRGVEAYKLLRRFTEAERHALLKQRVQQEEETERGRRVYEGVVGRKGGGSRATFEFNKFEQRRREMRNEAPPWKVDNHPPRNQRRSFLFYVLGGAATDARVSAAEILREYRRTGHLAGGRFRDCCAGSFGSRAPSGLFGANADEWARTRQRAERAQVVSAAFGRHIVAGVFAVTVFLLICMIFVAVKKQYAARGLYTSSESFAKRELR